MKNVSKKAYNINARNWIHIHGPQFQIATPVDNGSDTDLESSLLTMYIMVVFNSVLNFI